MDYQNTGNSGKDVAVSNKPRLALPLSAIAALVILAAAVVYYYYFYTPRPQPTIFSGRLLEINGDILRAEGVFLSRQGDLPPEIGATKREFGFRIGPETKLWERVVRFPQPEPGGRVFKISDLPTQESSGTLKSLTELSSAGQVYLRAEFAKSVLGANAPTAASVIYQAEITPQPQAEE